MKKLIFIMSLLPVVAMANPFMHDRFDDGAPPERHCMMEKHMRLPPYLHHLDLSKDQQKEIRDLIKDHFDKAKSDHKQEFALREQIHQLSFSADYDASKLAELSKQLSQMHEQKMLERAQLDHEIYTKLTDAQQQKLQKRMQAMAVLHSDS